MISEKLNIVLLTGLNPYQSNAGIWAQDISDSLTKQGHSVLILTRNDDEQFRSGVESIYGKCKWKSNQKSISGKLIWAYQFILRNIRFRKNERIKKDAIYYISSVEEKIDHVPTKEIMTHIPTKVDVIIYLFPHSFLDSRNLYELNQWTKAPIFVMPVDMASFTGGCHYANNCENYKKTCGCCPGLYSDSPTDLTYKNLMYKKKYISKTNVCTLGNTWTSDCLKQSYLYKDKPNYYIDVVVNETHYQPGDPKKAKAYFNIPEHKKIIFFGATQLENKRKGLIYLIEALTRLHEELSEKERAEIGVAVAGSFDTDIGQMFHLDVFVLGHLSHQELPLAFQAADVFVSPSIQDAGPMMVIQSMMCGTPVVAFEMGNAVDFIMNGETGYKAPLYDTEVLKNGIHSILTKTEDQKKKIAAQCREMALKRSSYDAFERKFVSVYESMMKKKTTD